MSCRYSIGACLVVLLTSCVALRPNNLPRDAATLQALIISGSTSPSDALKAFHELDTVPANEDPRKWVAAATEHRLNDLKRGLSFQAFMKRFVRTPIGLREITRQFGIRSWITERNLIDGNRFEATPFNDEDLHSPTGEFVGIYILNVPDSNDKSFPVWLKTDQPARVDEIIAIISKYQKENRDITVLETKPLSFGEIAATARTDKGGTYAH